MKSIFFKVNRFLDNYPLAALLIYLWLALPVLLTGAWLITSGSGKPG